MPTPAKIALAVTGLVAIGLLGYAGTSAAYSSLLQVAAIQVAHRSHAPDDATKDALSRMAVEPIAGEITKVRGEWKGAKEGARVVMEPSVAASAGKFRNWIQGARAGSEKKVKLMFMLRRSPRVRGLLEEQLLAVSTPGNPVYGQHYSKQQAEELASPLAGASQAVQEWLTSFGVKGEQVEVFSDGIRAQMSVAMAEDMLNTTLHQFMHKDLTDMIKIRASTPYSVPEEVAWALYVVGNLLQLPAINKPIVERNMQRNPWKVSARKTGSFDEDDGYDPDEEHPEEPFGPSDCDACEGFTTPGILQRAYNVPPHAPEGQEIDGTMSISQFQGVSYDGADLVAFEHGCHLDHKELPDKLIGPNHDKWCSNFLIQDICLESLLDIEYAKAILGEIPLWVFSHHDYGLFDWAIDVRTTVDKEPNSPKLHSVSYGNDEDQQVSAEYMDATNDQFMILGLMGNSILFASGDMGVWGRTGVTDDGKTHPDFPASSPYITSVGGTQFKTMGVVGAEASWGGSGGGFSQIFPRPAWQKEAVEKYFLTAAQESIDKDGDGQWEARKEHWTQEGRGYPDVSALGGTDNPYCVVANGPFHSHIALGVGGTSASCPVVAGIFARINQLRAQEKHPPMGFLNPFIYQNPGAFNDVKHGDNSWEGEWGFKALQGWDPATGMGTPNFPKLAEAAISAATRYPTTGAPTLEPPELPAPRVPAPRDPDPDGPVPETATHV